MPSFDVATGSSYLGLDLLELLTECALVYVRYISDRSSIQINLRQSVRSAIARRMSRGEVSASMFLEAEKEILHLMLQDNYARFKTSTEYVMALQMLETPEPRAIMPHAKFNSKQQEAIPWEIGRFDVTNNTTNAHADGAATSDPARPPSPSPSPSPSPPPPPPAISPFSPTDTTQASLTAMFLWNPSKSGDEILFDHEGFVCLDTAHDMTALNDDNDNAHNNTQSNDADADKMTRPGRKATFNGEEDNDDADSPDTPTSSSKRTPSVRMKTIVRVRTLVRRMHSQSVVTLSPLFPDDDDDANTNDNPAPPVFSLSSSPNTPRRAADASAAHKNGTEAKSLRKSYASVREGGQRVGVNFALDEKEDSHDEGSHQEAARAKPFTRQLPPLDHTRSSARAARISGRGPIGDGSAGSVAMSRGGTTRNLRSLPASNTKSPFALAASMMERMMTEVAINHSHSHTNFNRRSTNGRIASSKHALSHGVSDTSSSSSSSAMVTGHTAGSRPTTGHGRPRTAGSSASAGHSRRVTGMTAAISPPPNLAPKLRDSPFAIALAGKSRRTPKK